MDRRSALSRSLFLASVGVGAQVMVPAEAATAEVPKFVVDAFKAYRDDLQLAADTLVFDVRRWVEQDNWAKLREMLRGDDKGTSKLYISLCVPVDRIVLGNEDFLEGTEKSSLELTRLLKKANATAWGDESVRKERLLATWDDMARVVGKVMGEANKLIADEPEDMGRFQPYVLPVADLTKYGRSLAEYDARCKGIISQGMCVNF